jgi:hypothetical protein
VAVRQVSVARNAGVIAFFVSVGGCQMVLGSSGEMVGGHAVVVANRLEVFVQQFIGHGVRVIGHGLSNPGGYGDMPQGQDGRCR